MIQRVQTIWMILAAIAAFLTLKFLFYSGTLISDNLYHPLLATDNFLILILTSALGTGIIINIFLFKSRKIQMRITIIAILLECLILFLYIKQTNNYSTGSYSLWSALHILIIIFLILAARGIYKDSKLIKESNRLR
jgi:peptidoglycan/LPS O-acetylase OafA/YrhL